MIRSLTAADAGAMSALHAGSFETGWDAGAMMEHLERDLCLGLFDDQLRGFILIRAAADQAEILTVVVDSTVRRSSYGAQLLQHGEEALRRSGVDILFLEVAEDNDPAVALYRARGYEPIGRRPAYYKRAKGRVAALTFRKTLDAARGTG